jgi:3'-5' exoribonuclease
MPVRHFQDGQEVEQVLLVRDREVRARRDGSEYLRLTLADSTGSVSAVLPEGAGDCARECPKGAAVHVSGRFTVHARYGPQLQLASLRAAREDEFALDDLLVGPPQPPAQMEQDLRDLVATVQDPHLRRLLEAVFGPEADTWEAFRTAPAAKHYHQAYRCGLLEHCLTVAQAVSATSATFPGIDRDVAVTGAMLHDIGKLEAYTSDPLAIDMTDAGKLQGEIPLGYYRVRRLIEDIPGFPVDRATAVLHIILSHHGSLEYGSPVVPCTREATLVHMIDNLGGRLGSFDRLERELPEGSVWSAYDRAIGGGAFFGGTRAAPPLPHAA